MAINFAEDCTRLFILVVETQRPQGGGGNDTAAAIKLQICGNIGIGSVGGRGGICTHILLVLNTNTNTNTNTNKNKNTNTNKIQIQIQMQIQIQIQEGQAKFSGGCP